MKTRFNLCAQVIEARFWAGVWSGASFLLEEVVVTARKREELLQQVPISISAFSSEQLDALKVRDLADLSVWMPNVAMDDVGTFKGTANFSIRGLGVSSSIPGVEPTVGVFIDGVYIGQNAGIVIDMFDIERLEVLRGPQGKPTQTAVVWAVFLSTSTVTVLIFQSMKRENPISSWIL